MRVDDRSLTQGHAAGREDPAAVEPARIRVEYLKAGAAEPEQGVLASVRFGDLANGAEIAGAQAPLTIDVQLPVLPSSSVTELWRAAGPVLTARCGSLRYAYCDDFLFAVVEEDERAHGGVRPAAQAAYSALRRLQAESGFPHLLRIWNYLDAINDGPGDLERYRQFCVGRAHGLNQSAGESFPAATAIGRQHVTHQLQVFWLAGRRAGTPVENPRQVSAHQYPRVHGPVSPSFSRATLATDGTLFISGTASIVGHASRHHDDAAEQLEETLRNLAALTAHAYKQRATPPGKELLKVYLRDPALREPVAARLAETHPDCDVIYVAADICRRELLLEIECVRQER